MVVADAEEIDRPFPLRKFHDEQLMCPPRQAGIGK